MTRKDIDGVAGALSSRDRRKEENRSMTQNYSRTEQT